MDAEFFVYLAQMGEGGPVKIGRATDIEGRLHQIQSYLPLSFVLLASHRGWKYGREDSTEKQLHRRFASHRLRGEWFSPGAEIMEYVEAVRADVAAVEAVALARVKPRPRNAAADLSRWRGTKPWKSVSTLVGIDAGVLGQIELGKYVPGEVLRFRIQKATGIPVDAWPPRTVKAKKKGRAA